MTIRMTKPWNGYQPDAILSLGTTEEARLVSLGMATYDLNGDPDPEGGLVRFVRNLTGGIEVLMPDGTARTLPSLDNMQSNTPISITGSTSQKTLLVVRIPPEKLFPRCRINLDFEFSRNRNGTSDASYSIDLNDYHATAVGKGGQIISTATMSTSQNTRRETASIVLGADLRHQKFLQNNAGNGGVGNLNKYLDCHYNGNKGLSIVISSTPGNASDVFTIESYKIEVTK